MRNLWTLSLLIAVLATACSKPGVPFQPGGALSQAERRSLAEFHPQLENWNPTETAVWSQHGSMRHVCLSGGDIGSLSVSYWAISFDGEGGIAEANVIPAPNPSRPKAVQDVSALRIIFQKWDGGNWVGQGDFPLATCRESMRQHLDEDQRTSEVIRAWRDSGSTNFDELRQLLLDAKPRSTNTGVTADTGVAPPRR